MICEVQIEQKQGSKGRSFGATLLACASSNLLNGGGGDNTTRPIWAMFATSEGSAAPFAANLRKGRKAIVQGTSYRRGAQVYEFLKTAGYVFTTQRFAEGHIISVHLHSAFVLDPGMVDLRSPISFAILLPGEPIEVEESEEEEKVNHRYAEAPTELDRLMVKRLAPTFAAFMDRRTRAPLIPDPRFYELLLHTCLDKGLAALPTEETYYHRRWGRMQSFVAQGLSDVGICAGLQVHASHIQFEEVLSSTVTEFFEMKGGVS